MSMFQHIEPAVADRDDRLHRRRDARDVEAVAAELRLPAYDVLLRSHDPAR
jgi:hypothetical protein